MMIELTPAQRRAFRAQAHHLHPVVSVASNGLTPAVLNEVDAAPVARQGRLIETHARFPQGVNAGFMQVVDAHRIRLRVFERGVGETLACGTGACAAVVAGIARALLVSPVQVETRGGSLNITWPGRGTPVELRGPAISVFKGEIEL